MKGKPVASLLYTRKFRKEILRISTSRSAQESAWLAGGANQGFANDSHQERQNRSLFKTLHGEPIEYTLHLGASTKQGGPDGQLPLKLYAFGNQLCDALRRSTCDNGQRSTGSTRVVTVVQQIAHVHVRTESFDASRITVQSVL